jgi:Holliday junction resolvasome RuvABC endonuclease subunit
MGWAYGAAGEKPQSGSIECARDGASRGAIFSGAGRWITSFISSHPVDVLAIEAPLPGTFVQGHSNASTATILVGIPAVLEFMAFQLKVYQHIRVNQSSVKKWFVGVGKGDQKAAILAKCRTLGWIGRDDDDQSFDRSDALAVWSYVESTAAPRHAQPVDDLFLSSERRKREAEALATRYAPKPISERF